MLHQKPSHLRNFGAAAFLLLVAAAVLFLWPQRDRANPAPKIYPATLVRRPFAVAPPPVRYDVTAFGTLRAPDGKIYNFSPLLLNERGDVLGEARAPETTAIYRYALRLHAGRTTLMKTPADCYSWRVWGLSDEETPTVFAAARVGSRTGAFHRFVGRNGVWRDEGALPGTPVAGNARGDLVVTTGDDAPPVLCGRGTAGKSTMTRLDPGIPVALSDHGRVAGRWGYDTLVWDPKGRATVVPPGETGATFQPGAINDQGDVFLYAVANERISYFVWSDGRLHPLFADKEDGSGMRPVFLNNRGEVAGIGVSAGRMSRMSWSHSAYLWTKSRFHDLNDALAPHFGWRLDQVNGFNDRGQILAQGANGKEMRTFLLTPRK